jgi:hypothetical protein
MQTIENRDDLITEQLSGGEQNRNESKNFIRRSNDLLGC